MFLSVFNLALGIVILFVFSPPSSAFKIALKTKTNLPSKIAYRYDRKQPIISHSSHQPSLKMASSDESSPDISAWLNPNTRGGVIVWSIILISFPIALYSYFVGTGIEETIVGAYVGASFVLLSMLAWASTYLFRVVKKDMTYAKQLRDYENAVLKKRLDELADDEITALMEEIDVEVKQNVCNKVIAGSEDKA